MAEQKRTNSETSALTPEEAAKLTNEGVAAFKAGDYPKAVQLNWKAAEAGDMRAQYNLGVCYHNGKGVPQDEAKALEWYGKAAKQGLPEAQFNVGSIVSKMGGDLAAGQGVPQDNVKAAEFYAIAIEWYTKAADQGYTEAQFELAQAYRGGRQGVPQDYAKAADWFTKAAEQGHAEAQFQLAQCYNKGQGLPQDTAKAAEWFGKGAAWYAKAAEQGNAAAQERLGVAYYNGWGVPMDMEKAIFWWTESSKQGNVNAQLSLGVCAEGKTKEQMEEESLTRMIEDTPNNAAAYKKRGALYARKWDKSAAIADFKRALELDPGDEEIKKALTEAQEAARQQTERRIAEMKRDDRRRRVAVVVAVITGLMLVIPVVFRTPVATFLSQFPFWNDTEELGMRALTIFSVIFGVIGAVCGISISGFMKDERSSSALTFGAASAIIGFIFLKVIGGGSVGVSIFGGIAAGIVGAIAGGIHWRAGGFIAGALLGLLAVFLVGTAKLNEPTVPADNASVQQATATVINPTLNFRSGPSTSNKVIKQLKQGDTVTVTGEAQDGWLPVTHGEDSGWVSAELVEMQ